MKWIPATQVDIEFNRKYHAEWRKDPFPIISAGKFQKSDGTFFWSEQGYIPIGSNERQYLYLLVEESPSPSLQEAAEAYANEEWNECDPEDITIKKSAMIDFTKMCYTDGWNARDSRQTGPILTRELYDKISHIAVNEFRTEEDFFFDRTLPDRETFAKSLNLEI